MEESRPSLYVKCFPYEIPFLLYQFSEHFYRLLYQQYYFQQLGFQTLVELSNYSYPSGSICLAEDYIVTYIGQEEFVKLQQNVNHFNMYSEIVFLGLSVLIAFILGPLSDIIGRKPIMIIVCVGIVLTAVMQFVVIQFKLPVQYYLLCSVFFGGFGGYGTMMAVVLAIMCDVTPSKAYAIRIGIVEACIAFAKATSSLACNNWSQISNCSFFQPASWLMIVISALTLLCVVIMPETLCKERRENYRQQQSKGFEKIINGVKLYTQPHFLGWNNYWQLYAATLVLCLASLGVGGSNQIINYFLHNKPLEWSYDKVGIYGVLYAGSMGITLVIILPILVLLGLTSHCICLIGALFAIVTNILLANIASSWEMFTVGGVQGLFILAYPTMRSCISSLVGSEKQGSAFSIANGLQVIATIISTIVANELYQPNVDSKNNSGVVFWVMAGAWSAAVPIILLLHVKGTQLSHSTITVQETSHSSVSIKGYGAAVIDTTIQ